MPVPGEGVQEGVRGGVVGLFGAMDETVGRGEEDEGRQAETGRQVMQVPCGVGMPAQRLVEEVRGPFADRRAFPGGNRVDDGGERDVAGEAGQESGERFPVGGVAVADGQCGIGSCGERVRLPGCGTAGDEDVAGAEFGDEASDQCGGRRGGSAGDEYRAAGRGGGGGHVAVRFREDEFRYEYGAASDGEFVGAGGEGVRQRGRRGFQTVHVGEDEPSGVFALRGPDEAPYGRVPDVRRLVPRRDGVPGDDGQSGRSPVRRVAEELPDV